MISAIVSHFPHCKEVNPILSFFAVSLRCQLHFLPTVVAWVMIVFSSTKSGSGFPSP